MQLSPEQPVVSSPQAKRCSRTTAKRGAFAALRGNEEGHCGQFMRHLLGSVAFQLLVHLERSGLFSSTLSNVTDYGN